MNAIVQITIVVFLLISLTKSEGSVKSLEEAISVATGGDFGEIFEGKGGSATELLNLFHEKTNIDQEYMNKIFLEAAKVSKLEDLDNIHLDIYQAVDLANAVIKHFQANPMAGRKDEL